MFHSLQQLTFLSFNWIIFDGMVEAMAIERGLLDGGRFSTSFPFSHIITVTCRIVSMLVSAVVCGVGESTSHGIRGRERKKGEKMRPGLG